MREIGIRWRRWWLWPESFLLLRAVKHQVILGPTHPLIHTNQPLPLLGNITSSHQSKSGLFIVKLKILSHHGFNDCPVVFFSHHSKFCHSNPHQLEMANFRRKSSIRERRGEYTGDDFEPLGSVVPSVLLESGHDSSRPENTH